ncbi:MAG: LysR family transcriptional regulator [Sulfuritalea sp.]|nr:LysR family transcriptional regulator [Sulfuritalea sp.]
MHAVRLPSTKDLRAFEATMRLGSIKAAAEYLNLSPSAVSRRIQSLEEELGRQLFDRDVQGLTLTEAGSYYAAQLQSIFQALEQATLTVRKQSRQRLVVLAPSMISQAIVGQLDSFNTALPDIELILHVFPGSPGSDPGIATADIAFSWGNKQWEGWNSRLISPRGHLVPMCTPRLLKSGKPFSIEELPEQTWIVARHFESAWNLWYQGLGMPMPAPRRLLETPNGLMAMEAAERSDGVLIGFGFAGYPDFSILAGRFQPAHAFHALVPDHGFRMNTRPDGENPAISRFAAWFFETVWGHAPVQKMMAAQELRA